MTRPTDRAIAQSFWNAMIAIPGCRPQSLDTEALLRDAREIDAAAPEGAQTVAEVIDADWGPAFNLLATMPPIGAKLYTTPHQPTEAARDREDAERLEYMFRRYGWDRLPNPRALIDAARARAAGGGRSHA